MTVYKVVSEEYHTHYLPTLDAAFAAAREWGEVGSRSTVTECKVEPPETQQAICDLLNYEPGSIEAPYDWRKATQSWDFGPVIEMHQGRNCAIIAVEWTSDAGSGGEYKLKVPVCGTYTGDGFRIGELN